jgi:hypothetical protein
LTCRLRDAGADRESGTGARLRRSHDRWRACRMGRHNAFSAFGAGSLKRAMIASRQVKISDAPWELSKHPHRSIIGTCLSTAELRHLLIKMNVARLGETDHDLHRQGVLLAGQHDVAGKLSTRRHRGGESPVWAQRSQCAPRPHRRDRRRPTPAGRTMLRLWPQLSVFLPGRSRPELGMKRTRHDLVHRDAGPVVQLEVGIVACAKAAPEGRSGRPQRRPGRDAYGAWGSSREGSSRDELQTHPPS